MVFFISQEKSYEKSNVYPFCSYDIIFTLFDQFGPTIEHGKLEVFYFSRSIRNFNLPPLDFSPLGSPILQPKDTWRYLKFISNRELSFWQHIFTFTPTKPFWPLMVWRCWKTLLEVCHPLINNFYTKHVFYSLYFTDFLYGTSRVFLYSTLSRN